MVNYDVLKVSDETGDAPLMHIQSDRAIGATVISVDTVVGLPAKFIATAGTPLATGFMDPATITVFIGHFTGSTLIIDSFAPGSSDIGNTAGQIVVVKPNTRWADGIVDLAQVSHNNDGTIKTSAVQAALNIGGTPGAGWNALGFAPNTVVYNGNRSYTLTYFGQDLTAVLSNGMRFLVQRTVAAPTKCTSLNGTTQYYSKASPAGMTFTNNFVVSAWVKLTSYGTQGVIASRHNGTSGFVLYCGGTGVADGRIELAGFNGGIGNFMYSVSYQSIPLNKWVHIAAQLDMTTTSTGGTNNYIMIDGVEVPNTAVRGGTNPTALVQAGNLEVGSYNGGLLPFPGKIAQVAIYNAKVTEANIVATISQGLVGTETSLISAYSFNNSINDLNANANNLTANGSAVATATDSPFAQGATAGSLEYGIQTAISFSTNTTQTVQVPEGCALPTTGGISAVSYATVAVPYGFPKQPDKWVVENHIRVDMPQTSATAGTWYNLTTTSGVTGGCILNVPIGDWQVGYVCGVAGSNSVAGPDAFATLSTANNSESDFKMTGRVTATSSNSTVEGMISREKGLTLAAATNQYLNMKAQSNSTTTLTLRGGTDGEAIIYAKPAGL